MPTKQELEQKVKDLNTALKTTEDALAESSKEVERLSLLLKGEGEGKEAEAKIIPDRDYVVEVRTQGSQRFNYSLSAVVQGKDINAELDQMRKALSEITREGSTTSWNPPKRAPLPGAPE